MTTQITARASIVEALQAFDKLQSTMGDVGAWDTEPDYHFQDIVRRAVLRQPFPENPTASWWELYSSEPGAAKAAAQLTAEARKVYDLILKEADDVDTAYLKRFAWRVSF